jgi:hypothetical protein
MAALLYLPVSEVIAMEIRLGALQPDSSRDFGASSRKKRIKAKGPHDEEIWSERSDYEEIEDTYTPSENSEDETA